MESQSLLATADIMFQACLRGAVGGLAGGWAWLTVFFFLIPWVARR